MALAPIVPLLQEPSVFLPGENIAGYYPEHEHDRPDDHRSQGPVAGLTR